MQSRCMSIKDLQFASVRLVACGMLPRVRITLIMWHSSIRLEAGAILDYVPNDWP